MPVKRTPTKTRRPSDVLSPGRLPFAEDSNARASHRTEGQLPEFGPLPKKPKKRTATMTTPPVVILPVTPRTPTPFHEEPTLSYAAMARRPPQANRQATAPPRRDPPMPQYPRRQEGQVQDVRPERASPRKTDVWRTADRRPLCYHCGEADHIYRGCPYRRLGLRGFHPNDPRPSAVPPYFHEEFETKTVRSKEDVTVSCEVFGETPLTVAWSKDRRPFGDLALPRFVLQEDTTAEGIVSKVFIPSVGREDSGVFVCEATNSFGKKDRTIQLIVQGPPDIPRDIHVDQVTSRSATLFWTQPHTGNSPLLGYTVLYVPEADKVTSAPLSLRTGTSENRATVPGLIPGTAYILRVVAENAVGKSGPSDEIRVVTEEEDPPSAPQLMITSKSSSTLELEWKFPEVTETPITGYVVHYKSEYGEWQETQVNSKLHKHLLTNLICGNRYQVTITAFNAAGRGIPSELVNAETTGRGPIPPQDKSWSVLMANSSSISVNLDGWSDGGCPITFFVVQYKPHMQPDWVLLSNNIRMAQSPVTIPDLAPGTWYDVMVSAYNDAGATEVEYRLATLTLSGATVAPLAAQSQESGSSFLRDPAILVPVACAVVVVLVICLVVGVVLVLRRRENTYDSCHTQHIYSSESVRKTDSISMSAYGKDKHFCDSSGDEGATQREPLYYPSPYATTQVSAGEMSSGSPSRHLQANMAGDYAQSAAGTLQRNRYGNRMHLYDVPLRPKQNVAELRLGQ
ncbi:hypothetical protein HPB47_020612 [Ixodes persulcatus]|uniref:Uncharacterized protein n=1 Tax=Ixodes persulcatus TaxID=34615 RepID=A0AC60QEV1_IXOPE|nr:hypothetical protein HPB47_020612 [Ixodes persulcatus]